LRGVLAAPSIHEHKRCEEQIVPRRDAGSSVSPLKCDEAELKGWPPLGVCNTQQRNLSKALHVWPKASIRPGLQCTVLNAHQQEFLMANQPKKLDDLFHDTLKDIYFAEKKILATLPKMAKAAQSPDLKKAFAKHHSETQGHIDRLEDIV